MAIKTFIFKNTTDANLNIADLSGIRLSASGTVDVTEMFTNYVLYESSDLKTVISGGQMVINDGTADLSIEDALIYCSYETPITEVPGVMFNTENGTYSIVVGGNEYASVTEFSKLTDTPTTYSGHGDKYLKVTTTESGIEFVAVDDDGVDGGDVEGFYGSSTGQSSTTSTTFQTKVDKTFTPQTAGYFEITHSYIRSHEDTGVFHKTRLRVDNSTNIQEVTEELYNFKYEDGAWGVRSGTYVMYFDASSHNLKLQYCTGERGKAAYIKEAFITIKRLVLA